jgi:hypothetical protein
MQEQHIANCVLMECSAPSIHPSIHSSWNEKKKKKKKHLEYKRMGERCWTFRNIVAHTHLPTHTHTLCTVLDDVAQTLSLFYSLYTHADFWALLFLSAPAKSWKAATHKIGNGEQSRAEQHNTQTYTINAVLSLSLSWIVSLCLWTCYIV